MVVPKKKAVVVSWSWSANNSVVLATDSIVSNEVCVTEVELVPSGSNTFIDSCEDVTLVELSTSSTETVENVLFSVLVDGVVISKVVVSTIGELNDTGKVDRISVVVS